MNPRIEIDYNKLKYNTATIVEQCRKQDIHVVAVTKGFCAIPQIAQAIFEGGVKYFGDSRLENLIKLKDFPIEKILLRLPMISQAEAVVKHADISLNSEIETIKTLNQYAKKAHKLHKIVLMLDLGDLREGIFHKEEIDTVCDLLKEMTNIKVVGIGTNLTCFGGVIPEEKNLTRLVDLGRHIEEALDTKLEMISGGNSSSFYLLEKKGLVEGINQLRLGEAILLGTESAYGENIQGLHQDVFTLVAEIIEIKEKPSMPIGKIGRDAFGNVPVFVDQGIRKRGILAIGKQDLATHNIYPIDPFIKIIGSSSDHLIVDITDTQNLFRIGDEMRFHVSYGAMLALMTSEYVYKNVVKS
ncbi:ornithine racemase [Clostridium aceticum]|uniref:Ornithine racemase n=1 Tax=Clostridium aceticum TaxID=84022 RepID=A0A0D8IFT8_9CLOT|nr:ornithine racemase Orr [Clostridium aceticum]AKL95202.1 ornithine racemase [Clostridium aceticum]KJF28071.1 alanine racemase [Clostridium aceticum]